MRWSTPDAVSAFENRVKYLITLWIHTFVTLLRNIVSVFPQHSVQLSPNQLLFSYVRFSIADAWN
jgi:hypothetical protein